MLFFRRITQAFTLSGLTLTVNFAGQLLSVPILMSHWGVRTYGAWVALTSLASTVTLMNMGIQSHVTNQLILLTARGQREQAARLLGSALKIYAALGLAAVSAIAAGLYFVSPASFVDTAGMTRAESSGIVLAHTLLAVYGIFGGVLMNLLRVGQELPRQLAYGLVERTIMVSVPMLAAALGWTPVQASWAMIGLLGIAEAFMVRDVFRRSPAPIRFSAGSLHEGLQIVGPSLFFFGSGLSTQILTTGVTLVISSAAGAVAVATFSTALMMTNLFRLILNQVVNVLSGEVTLLFGREEFARLANWYRLLWKGSASAALAAAAVLVLLGPGIVRVWTRDRVRLDFELNLLLAVYLVAHAPGILSAGFGLAMNRQRAIFFVQLAAGAGTLAMGSALIARLGLNGIVWALLAAQSMSTAALTFLNWRWVHPGNRSLTAAA